MSRNNARSRKLFPALVLPLLVGLVLVGCAKRPAVTQASAPAPAGSAAAITPPAAVSESTAVAVQPRSEAATPAQPSEARPSESGAAAAQAPAAAPRPESRDFIEVAALKDIHFDFDKSNIRPDAARSLDENIKWMKDNPNHLILIEGHCDERGTNEYNLALGDRRAKSTLNYLVSHGVASSRISTISYGEERPVCTEHNEACWAKNRRAHFLAKAQEGGRAPGTQR